MVILHIWHIGLSRSTDLAWADLHYEEFSSLQYDLAWFRVGQLELVSSSTSLILQYAGLVGYVQWATAEA